MTRQQKWAHEALKRVQKHQGAEASESKYRTLCLKMPSLLKQSGLVQSLAFIRARDEIGKTFCDELAEVYGVKVASGKTAGTCLQDRAQEVALSEYLILSRDLIEVSVWFRRFAQADLKDPDATAGQRTGDDHAGTA